MLDVRTAQSNGLLSFQLPGDTSTLYAEATLISDDTTSGFIWSGKLLNTPGYVSFVHYKGKKAGFIQAGPAFYEITPLDSTYQFFVKRNTSYYSGECGLNTDIEEPPPPTDASCQYFPEYNTCPALITVLLILTPEAKTTVESMYGNVDYLALLGQASVNAALGNSDIPNKQIRVKWVVKSGFPFSSDDILEDLGKVPAFSEPERTNHNADLVVFVPHVIYTVGAGVANLPDPPDPDQAFSIVLPGDFLSRMVFAHELGHNWGCRHNWPYDLGNDQTKVCAHAKRWLPINTIIPGWYQEIDSWITIMGRNIPDDINFLYTIENGPEIVLRILNDHRILHYSNPDVSYNGEPTGRDFDPIADNADHIRNTLCEISNYRPGNELSVSITASPCSTPITLTATISPPDIGLPGVAPYTVYWFWNTSGVFTTGAPPQVLGTGETLELDSHPNCPYFWVKCLVVSSDNVVTSRIMRVNISPCNCLMDERPVSTEADPSILSRQTTTLFPNPVSQNDLFLQTAEYEVNDDFYYSIVDVWGKNVSAGKAEKIERSQLRLSVEHLSSGIYFLSFQKPDGTQENHKFIISKPH